MVSITVHHRTCTRMYMYMYVGIEFLNYTVKIRGSIYERIRVAELELVTPRPRVPINYSALFANLI